MWVEIGPDDEDTLMAAGALGEWDFDDRKAISKAIERLLAVVRAKGSANALATWLRDWAIIPDMNIAKQVRRVKQSIEADCAQEIENNRMARLQNGSASPTLA